MSYNVSEYVRAKNLHEQGLHDGALEILEFHLVDKPNDFQSQELMGIVLHSLARFTRAHGALQIAQRARELTPEGRLALADCKLFVGDKSLARELYRAVALLADLPDNLLPGLA
ncbi:MAG: hypothetical protein AAF497_01445, partial [Planctomycetota bacterium]